MRSETTRKWKNDNVHKKRQRRQTTENTEENECCRSVAGVRGRNWRRMEAALAELERVQTRILQRISDLEVEVEVAVSHLPLSEARALVQREAAVVSSIVQGVSELELESDTEARLSSILRSNGVKEFSFKRVPSDYYDWPLEARRDALAAPSVHHLCKSIVLVNTQAQSNVVDCSDCNNSKYYVVVVQYSARFNAESVKNFLYSLNDGKIAKKKFNLRLAPEETSVKLTGYEHNAVTCIGMKTDIPVILDEAITKLNPDFFWLGGGEVDLKLGIRTSEFINSVKPFVVSCSGI
ncbi:YbaK/aminoacyl-tRNA synthetase-associated domain containing protein [Trema orientale]|uniref:YbaK/aminoacyl-tRNA synthetase-associated domain containing protein n=1 Tax=Trema orientale TaxID=63057 RepID=A0A2P5F5D5_TREOI|nr:YbaK/aminoacyl-tRNA synthetase-associated domain containing protein [Trema orientale]